MLGFLCLVVLTRRLLILILLVYLRSWQFPQIPLPHIHRSHLLRLRYVSRYYISMHIVASYIDLEVAWIKQQIHLLVHFDIHPYDHQSVILIRLFHNGSEIFPI